MSNDAKSIFFVDTLDSVYVLSHQTNTSIYVVLGLHPTYHWLSATYTYTQAYRLSCKYAVVKYHNTSSTYFTILICTFHGLFLSIAKLAQHGMGKNAKNYFRIVIFWQGKCPQGIFFKKAKALCPQHMNSSSTVC